MLKIHVKKCPLNFAFITVALAIISGCTSISTNGNIQSKRMRLGSPAVRKSFIYAGAPNQNDSIGAVYICNENGAQCTPIDLKKIAPDPYQTFASFGQSVYTTSQNLFIGTNLLSENSSYGTAYKCDLNGNNCVQILSGIAPDNNSFFANAIGGIKDNLFFGAPGVNDTAGAVYKCDSNGAYCAQTNSGINLASNDRFGASLFATNTNLFVGAWGTNNNAGAVYKCNLNGENCVKINSGISSAANDYFGASVLATSTNLFVGASGVNNSAGAVYKCNLDGENCAPIDSNIKPIANYYLGVSLYASGKNIFIGAAGPAIGDSLEGGGVLYKCDLNGENCAVTNSGISLQAGDSFGSSITGI